MPGKDPSGTKNIKAKSKSSSALIHVAAAKPGKRFNKKNPSQNSGNFTSAKSDFDDFRVETMTQMRHQKTMSSLLKYADSRRSKENLDFLSAVDAIEAELNKESIEKKQAIEILEKTSHYQNGFVTIYDNYISDNSPNQINLCHTNQQKLVKESGRSATASASAASPAAAAPVVRTAFTLASFREARKEISLLVESTIMKDFKEAADIQATNATNATKLNTNGANNQGRPSTGALNVPGVVPLLLFMADPTKNNAAAGSANQLAMPDSSRFYNSTATSSPQHVSTNAHVSPLAGTATHTPNLNEHIHAQAQTHAASNQEEPGYQEKLIIEGLRNKLTQQMHAKVNYKNENVKSTGCCFSLSKPASNRKAIYENIEKLVNSLNKSLLNWELKSVAEYREIIATRLATHKTLVSQKEPEQVITTSLETAVDALKPENLRKLKFGS